MSILITTFGALIGLMAGWLKWNFRNTSIAADKKDIGVACEIMLGLAWTLCALAYWLQYSTLW